MNGPVLVRSGNQLKNIESTIFELLDEGVEMHILLEGHRCPTDETYQFIRSNVCNMRKVIFASRRIILKEFIVLDSVLQSEGYVGFRYSCPGCDAYMDL